LSRRFGEYWVDKESLIPRPPLAGLLIARCQAATSFYPKVKVNAQTTFRAFITKNGCTDTLEQTVLIDVPKPISINGSTIVCNLATALYTATPYSLGQYNWEPFAHISYQNRDSARIVLTANRKIKLNYISEYNCLSSDSLLVQVANANINLQMDTIGCKDEILTLNYSANIPGGVYSFTPNSNIISSNCEFCSIQNRYYANNNS
jgi:hypothetical protein